VERGEVGDVVEGAAEDVVVCELVEGARTGDKVSISFAITGVGCDVRCCVDETYADDVLD
jgi:hypothetical protein